LYAHHLAHVLAYTNGAINTEANGAFLNGENIHIKEGPSQYTRKGGGAESGAEKFREKFF